MTLLQTPTLSPTPTSPYCEPEMARTPAPAFAAGQWVQLLTLPNPLSSDQALLLCPCGADQWVTWVPDHGEAVVSRRQFTVLA